MSARPLSGVLFFKSTMILGLIEQLGLSVLVPCRGFCFLNGQK